MNEKQLLERSFSDWFILTHIAFHPGTTQYDLRQIHRLSDQTKMSYKTVKKVLDKYVNDGLITKREHRRKSLRYFLSDKGKNWYFEMSNKIDYELNALSENQKRTLEKSIRHSRPNEIVVCRL